MENLGWHLLFFAFFVMPGMVAGAFVCLCARALAPWHPLLKLLLDAALLGIGAWVIFHWPKLDYIRALMAFAGYATPFALVLIGRVLRELLWPAAAPDER